MKLRISRSALTSLPAPGNERRFHWDTKTPGFGVRQHPSGKLTFLYQGRINGHEFKKKLGEYPSVTPERAREIVDEIKANGVLGRDLIADNRKKAEAEATVKAAILTIEMLIEQFKATRFVTKRPSSQAEDLRRIENTILPALAGKDAKTITRAELDLLHKSMKDRPYEANRTLALLHTIFAPAALDGLIRFNPAAGIQRFPESKRERYLTDDEAARVADAIDFHHTDYSETVSAIRLLMLTGSRRNEVLAAKWEDIDLAKSVWSRPTRKTTPDRVPLNEAAVAVLHDLQDLTGRYTGDVFSLTLEGRITALKRVWRSIGLQAGISMRLHDLRHNFASVLASRKVPILVLSKLLGHASITTTQRYAHLFDEALREGIEKAVR